jgi:beta-aspartyl-peptidase (threonine type)
MCSIICHGGASSFTEDELVDTEKNNTHHPVLSVVRENISEGLKRATIAGIKILQDGGTSEEAVETTIKILEDNELFNAGKGSSPNVNQKFEMDAMLMTSEGRYAGVAGCMNVKNPISLSRQIMTKYNRKILKGNEAVLSFNPYITGDEYFKSEVKNKMYCQIRGVKYGTVGCVALDYDGVLCAGSSTGGSLKKEAGRLGDTPMPGVGTMVNNYGAVTTTGYGEEFMKYFPAGNILNRMELLNESMYTGMKNVFDKMDNKSGGAIGITPEGFPQAFFNSNAMHYAYSTGEDTIVEFYRGLK